MAQNGQLYPWLCTCIASTCSQSRVLYLVVHRQSLHCQTSPSFSIFSEISASRSTHLKERLYFSTPCGIYFYAGAKHSLRSRTWNKRGSCSRGLWLYTLRLVTFTTWSSTEVQKDRKAIFCQLLSPFGFLWQLLAHLASLPHFLLQILAPFDNWPQA